MTSTDTTTTALKVTERYTHVKHGDILEYSDKFWQKLQESTARKQARQKDDPLSPVELAEWQKKQVAKWARAEAKQFEDPTEKKVFPSLILEFMFGFYGLQGFLDNPEVSRLLVFEDGMVAVDQSNEEEGEEFKWISDDPEFGAQIVDSWLVKAGVPLLLIHWGIETEIELSDGFTMKVEGQRGERLVTVSKHNVLEPKTVSNKLTLATLENNGAITKEQRGIIAAAVKSGRNIFVGGIFYENLRRSVLQCLIGELDSDRKIVYVDAIPDGSYAFVYNGKPTTIQKKLNKAGERWSREAPPYDKNDIIDDSQEGKIDNLIVDSIIDWDTEQLLPAFASIDGSCFSGAFWGDKKRVESTVMHWEWANHDTRIVPYRDTQYPNELCVFLLFEEYGGLPATDVKLSEIFLFYREVQ